MSLPGTKRHWICIPICTMLSPGRPSSINVPMSAWSKHWKTGNRETTERRVHRGVLNECGGSVQKNEEEEHVSCTFQRSISLATKNVMYTFQKKYIRWEAVCPSSEWSIPLFRADFLCFTSKSVEV